MNSITLNRPLEGEPLLPRTTQRTRNRFGSLVIASGLAGVDLPTMNERVASGFFADPAAGVVLTATSCNRPLFHRECEALAKFTQMDLVLLRFDPLVGASFDILLDGSCHWLCNYLAWRRVGDALWLVPSHTAGPFFRLSSVGLEAFESAPYESGYQRYAGIIRSIETPTFEAKF